VGCCEHGNEPHLYEDILASQKGLCSMYLLVSSISIEKFCGKVSRMCEINTVCGEACMWWRLQEISVGSIGKCCSDLHSMILPKDYSVTGAVTYICIGVIFTVICTCSKQITALPCALVTDCESDRCKLLSFLCCRYQFFLQKVP
jgi:hypothetical protein